MVRKSMPNHKLKQGRLLHWLPISTFAVLTLVLVAKWAIANQAEPKEISRKSRQARSIDSQWLLRDSNSDVENTIQAGTWTMEGSSWNFENESVSTGQLSQALCQRNNAELGSDWAEHLALIDLIPVQRAHVETVGAITTRSIDFGSVRATVCYRESKGQKYFISARFANRMDADRWQLITLTPKIEVSNGPRHLLPMSNTVSGVCQRLGKTGSLQYEILESEQSIEELVLNWSSQGWFVQSFSTEDVKNQTVWQLTNGSQSIHVRATSNAENSKLSLVMTALHKL